jgi:hypothetical protein
MTQTRYIPRPLGSAEGQPFDSAEQAWLWYGACQLARQDGIRPIANAGEITRPCDPDDIYCAIQRLRQRRLISSAHISVLGHFAVRQHPPALQDGSGAGQIALWSEALDRLGTELRRKGIVA